MRTCSSDGRTPRRDFPHRAAELEFPKSRTSRLSTPTTWPACGATHVPCLLFDAPGLGQIGVLGGEATFDEATLASANPPTCGHLARASAYEVPLRRATRVIS